MAAKKILPPITVESLEKDHGKNALRVYAKIAIIGGHGYSSHCPALDPNGYDERTAKAVNEELNKK